MDEPVPYNLDVLEFSLEDRRDFIGEHDEEMRYICNLLHSFVADVKHAYDLKMSPSVVSHLAYNLILTIANGLTDLTIYEYLRGAYLLDDEYDTVYDIWIKFREEFKVAFKLLESLVGVNYFDSEDDKVKFLEDIIPPGTETLKSNRSLVNLERRLATINGLGLLNTLEYCLVTMYNWLTDLKNGNYKGLSTDYDQIYEANYRLYRITYWPREEKLFRKYVEKIKPRSEELNQSFLEKCLQEEKKDFLHTSVGVLWSEYGDDKKELYFEAKRIKLSEEQWKYYFKCICRFEEYERWIEELINPQSNENDIGNSDSTGNNTQINTGQKIAAFFNDGTLKVEKPHQLYFLLLAMWARHLLSSKEMTSFVRTIKDAYPAIYKVENDSDWTKIVTSLQNMNGKANKYFDEVITDQATMIEYIDMMYPKKNNGERRKDTQSAVDLANKLFLGLK